MVHVFAIPIAALHHRAFRKSLSSPPYPLEKGKRWSLEASQASLPHTPPRGCRPLDPCFAQLLNSPAPACFPLTSWYRIQYKEDMLCSAQIVAPICEMANTSVTTVAHHYRYPVVSFNSPLVLRQ